MIDMASENIGGYDYEFVDDPSDTLICQICHFPSKEPHLSECCGHTFCKSCLEAAKRVTTVNAACPVCRSEQFTTMPNRQADRIIRSLNVYCSNKGKGCSWQGEVNNIISHRDSKDGCQFQIVNCPNDCGIAYQRRYLTIHVETECPCRKVDCQYCHDTGEHQFIEGQHKDECPKFPLPCPYKCEIGTIPRDEMKEHINTCKVQLVQCKYHTVGCDAKIARKDQQKHSNNKMDEHLSLCVSEIANTKVSMKNCEDSLRKATSDLTQKLTAAERKITTSKQQAATTERKIAALKAQLTAAENEIATSKRQSSAAERENAALKQQIQTIKEEVREEINANKKQLEQIFTAVVCIGLIGIAIILIICSLQKPEAEPKPKVESRYCWIM